MGSPFSWESSPVSFGQLNCDSTGERSSQTFDLHKSVVYQDLRDSLGRFDMPARFFGTGSLSSEPRDSPDAQKPQKETNQARSLRAKHSVKGRPLSLRMLKRKNSRVMKSEVCQERPLMPQNNQIDNRERGGSVKSALSSLLFIIKALQEHTLRLRKLLVYEDLQEVVSMVNTEMQETFLWLFQQVYCCTPKLMLLTMVLLADFTVFSMGKHVALAVTPTTSVSRFDGGASATLERASFERSIPNRFQHIDAPQSPSKTTEFLSSSPDEAGGGKGVARTLNNGGEADGNEDVYRASRAMCSEDESSCGDACLHASSMSKDQQPGGLSARENRLRKALSIDVDSQPAALLDQEVKNMFVAPISADLEPDNYACYDRTDLNYQHAIITDSSNPLLLANYAQFMHLVRHDDERAEKLFRRAMRADPWDGEVMGRFASFQWAAKGDRGEADKLYRAALDVDPTNSYHAGLYAHFLWSSGDEGTSCQLC